MRWLFRLLSVFWLFRAASRGPRGVASYAVRRSIRKGINRKLRKIR